MHRRSLALSFACCCTLLGVTIATSPVCDEKALNGLIHGKTSSTVHEALSVGETERIFIPISSLNTVSDSHARQAIASSEHFKTECWEKAPVHLRDVPNVAGILKSEDLKDLVFDGLAVSSTAPEENEDGKVTWGSDSATPNKGTQVTDEVLDGLWTRGATLVVTSAGLILPAVAQACLQVCSIFGFPSNANVYVTGSGATLATPVHNDAHDVLILHLQGEKTWIVYPPTYPLPYRDQERGKSGDVLEEWEKKGGREMKLKSGDVLYIPRGWLHETHTHGAEEGISIHATVSLAAAEVTNTWWNMLWCAAINSVFGSESSRMIVEGGGLPPAATKDVISPTGTYYEAARLNHTLTHHMRKAIPFGFLAASVPGVGVTDDPEQIKIRRKLNDIHHDEIVDQMTQDMETLSADPDGHVKAIKPLLNKASYMFALSHFMQAHDVTLHRYIAAYMGFLGEDVQDLGPGGASPYGEAGGMHLDQMEKQAKADKIIMALNADAHDKMRGCMNMGSGAPEQDVTDEGDEAALEAETDAAEAADEV